MPSDSPSPGIQAIGRYVVQRLLGRGAMGQVYLATDPLLKRPVAIKVVRDAGDDDGTVIERFRREAEISARLNHPNIITVYDVGVDPVAGPFLAMEYVEGASLATLIKTGVDRESAMRLLIQGAAALDAAHSGGIVHRDVKPENILVSVDGRLKLMDFGIARGGESRLTQAGMVFGTPSYTAPELLTGSEPSEATDQYAFAVTAFECFTGTLPFQGSSVGTTLYRIVHEAPEMPAGLSPGLERVFQKALAKDPLARHPDLRSFLGDLMDAVELPEETKIRFWAVLHGDHLTLGSHPFSKSPADRRPTTGAPLPPPVGSGPLPAAEPEPDQDQPTQLQAVGAIIPEERPESESGPDPEREPDLGPQDATSPGLPSGSHPAWEPPAPPQEPEAPAAEAPEPEDRQTSALPPVAPPAASAPKPAPQPASRPAPTAPKPAPAKSGSGKILGGGLAAAGLVAALGFAGWKAKHPRPAAPVVRLVAVSTEPEGAELTLDGKPAGKAPLDELKVEGNPLIRAELPGFLPAEHRLEPGEQNVSLTLAPAPLKVAVHSDPAGAEVTVDDKPAGVTPLENLEVSGQGKHAIKVHLKGFQDWEGTLERGAALPDPIRLSASRYTVRVVSEPAGADVVVSGIFRGTAPLEKLEVSAEGPQTLLLKLKGYEDWKGTFDRNRLPSSPIHLKVRTFPLVVRTEPSGASVFLNGESLGPAPIAGKPVPVPGPHKLTVRLEGYVDWEGEASPDQPLPPIKLQPKAVKKDEAGKKGETKGADGKKPGFWKRLLGKDKGKDAPKDKE